MTNPIARDRDARRRDAARNNAEWCDAVYRSHGRSGIFNEAIWFSRAKPIRFYPNAITLAGPDRAAEQLRCIQDLVADRIQRPWAVKDSFSTLDLTALGFRVLFDAEWIYRPRSLKAPGKGTSNVRWTKVETADELARWAWAWDRELHTHRVNIFLPSLLAEGAHTVLAGYRGEDIVAGCVASRSAGVLGITNIFAHADNALTVRAGCIGALMDFVPGIPLVGYERGDGLEAARALGFEPVGPLRIWTQDLATSQTL